MALEAWEQNEIDAEVSENQGTLFVGVLRMGVVVFWCMLWALDLQLGGPLVHEESMCRV